MFRKALRTTVGRLYSLYMLRLSGVVAVLSAALTSALFVCAPSAAADDSTPGYALEGFHWRCGVPITWTSPNAKIQAWAAPVIDELKQLTGIDLEWTPTRPANIQISFSRRDPHFQLVDATGAPAQPSAAITYLPQMPEYAGLYGIPMQQAIIRLNPQAVLAKGISPKHHQEAVTWVLRHELGHALGLAHVYEGAEVMGDGYSDAFAFDYQAGDIAGLKAVGCTAPLSSTTGSATGPIVQ